MLLLYVDDAGYGGKGTHYEHVMAQTLKRFNIGKQSEKEFDFLGRRVTQSKDFRIEADMDKYIRALEKSLSQLPDVINLTRH